ncbi:MAG: response regulator [Myxococcales bacterium]|nr:response regulator [Myxococcales bacterium]
MTDSRITILIADDDLEILRMLRRALSENYRVVEAHNGREALELIAAEHPAMVVLDVMMPELNGWEVAKQLRKNRDTQHIGILMLTAIGERLNEMTSPLYGADDQLDKPFDLDEVLERIDAILQNRS